MVKSTDAETGVPGFQHWPCHILYACVCLCIYIGVYICLYVYTRAYMIRAETDQSVEQMGKPSSREEESLDKARP